MEDMANRNGKIKVNYQRTAKLAKAIVSKENRERIHHLKELQYPGTQLFPDAIVPKGIKEGSLEHALFLFHSVSIDSMRQSVHVYRVMRKIQEEMGSLTQLARMGKKRLENLLADDFGEVVRNPQNSTTDPVGTLLKNSRKLKKEYRGNPLNLRSENVEETLGRICEFNQFGNPKATQKIM